jgi:transcriptional pleiotropic repressor
MIELLEKMRILNHLLQGTAIGEFSFEELSKVLSGIFKSNVYMINEKGWLLGEYLSTPKDRLAVVKDKTVDSYSVISDEMLDSLLNIKETAINLNGAKAKEIFHEEEFPMRKNYMFVPITGNNDERLGTLIAARYTPKFTDEDIILGESSALIVGFEIKRVRSLRTEKNRREKKQVEKALRTLSYSEVRAIKKIVDQLGSLSGELVASKIADQTHITRSVIVTAFRKLESADIIESRSLGMKGTYIKVLNDKLNEGLQDPTLY